MSKKIALIIIVALALAGTVYAAASGRAGDGYLIDAYALENGGSLTIAIDRRTHWHYVVFALDDMSAGMNTQEYELPGYYRLLGRPDVITEVCAGYVHVWMTWSEDEVFLHYSWRLPLDGIEQHYFPIVCRGS